MSFLGIDLSAITPSILAKAIELFLDKNELKINPVAWEVNKANFLILKLELWFDKGPNVITDIKLHDRKNNKIFFYSNYGLTDDTSTWNAKFDSSYLDKKLKTFSHYYGVAFSISPEHPESLSVVFKLNEEVELKNLELIFVLGQKEISFDLNNLIAEVHTIFDFVNQRNNNSAKEALEFME